MDKNEYECNLEAMRVFGKREMLWNMQRQVRAAKQFGKVIDEKWILTILDSLAQYQTLEEINWGLEDYIESEVQMDIIRDSKELYRILKQLN